mmetsp:Transcript_4938/g.9047  ORF Transcript_4938/g.9047 Transcript_4938/m.9047 type:complete len:202 (+) Transcript_4938:172-777(+)
MILKLNGKKNKTKLMYKIDCKNDHITFLRNNTFTWYNLVFFPNELRLSTFFLKNIKNRLKVKKFIEIILKKKSFLFYPNLSMLLGIKSALKLINKFLGLLNLTRLPASKISRQAIVIYGSSKSIPSYENIYTKLYSLDIKGENQKSFTSYHQRKLLKSLIFKSSLSARIDFFQSRRNLNYGVIYRGLVEIKDTYLLNFPKI